jgi:hypothetical protein
VGAAETGGVLAIPYIWNFEGPKKLAIYMIPIRKVEFHVPAIYFNLLSD